jgi:hypothetical protein
MVLVYAISGYPVDALVDMVGGSESGIYVTTVHAGLDRRD